jgi:hypothetical protein
MLSITEENAAYALLLARNGKRDQAVQVCDLSHAMARQLMEEQTISDTLAALAIDQIGARGRAVALKAAGDQSGAQAAAARAQALRQFSTQTSAILIKAQWNAIAGGGGTGLAPEVARAKAAEERKVVAGVVAQWCRIPGS